MQITIPMFSGFEWGLTSLLVITAVIVVKWIKRIII